MTYEDEPTGFLRWHLVGLQDMLNRCQGDVIMEPQLRERIESISDVIASRGSYQERVEMGDVDVL